MASETAQRKLTLDPTTVAECESVLQGMRSISNVFYLRARALGFHQFLEFNGLLAEYIAVCEDALGNGVDFRTATHLPMKDYRRAYINEKLDCIFDGDVTL